jgi:hypothetical protein
VSSQYHKEVCDEITPASTHSGFIDTAPLPAQSVLPEDHTRVEYRRYTTMKTLAYNLAPELDAVAWLNTPEPMPLSEQRSKIVVIHAFQMLCPGCVTHGIPQASAIHDLYARSDVQVIGLHSVFEHHKVMNIDALKAFVAEYLLAFPIAVDRPSDSSPIPKTMTAYDMKGTPTLVVLDKNGRVRLNHFGRLGDMQVGSIIGSLLAESTEPTLQDKNMETHSKPDPGRCDDAGCLR